MLWSPKVVVKVVCVVCWCVFWSCGSGGSGSVVICCSCVASCSALFVVVSLVLLLLRRCGGMWRWMMRPVEWCRTARVGCLIGGRLVVVVVIVAMARKCR